MLPPNPPCAASSKSGEPCRGYATTGSTFCWAHDPARRAEAQASRRVGGLHRRRPRDVPQPPPAILEPSGLAKLLQHAIAVAVKCDPSLAQARTLASLVGSAIALREHVELGARIAELEQAIEDLGPRRVA